MLRLPRRGEGPWRSNWCSKQPPSVRWAQIVGDNLGVVRYGGEKGHLRRPDMHRPLAAALADAAERGWHLHWRAVRRRLNHAADAAATEGVERAHRLKAQGNLEPDVEIQWFI